MKADIRQEWRNSEQPTAKQTAFVRVKNFLS
jgi:hypothetical protein